MRRVTEVPGTYTVQGKGYGPFSATDAQPFAEVPDALVQALGLPVHDSDPQLREERAAQAKAAALDAEEGIHVDQILQANADLKASLDGVYSERAHLVAALSKLWPASIEQHDGEDWDDQWRNVVIIDLPTGQVSWHIALADLDLFAHLPRDAGRVWDGHTTEEKYDRLDDLSELDIVTLLDAIGWARNSTVSPVDLVRNLHGAVDTNRDLLANATERVRDLEAQLAAQASATPAAPGPVTLPADLRDKIAALRNVSDAKADEIMDLIREALAPAPAPEADPQ